MSTPEGKLERDLAAAIAALQQVAEAKDIDAARWAANSALARLTPINLPPEPALQSERQCVLCTGCETDSDFDYCRACGFVPPVSNETARQYLTSFPAVGSQTLAETIRRARPQPPPPPLMPGAR